MRKLYKLILPLFFLFILQNNSKAQTTLVAGDIAFSGYISTAVGTESFSFVLLTNITATTVINFTDNGWLNTNVFRAGEQTVTWTASVALNAGSEITIAGPSGGAATATLAGGGATGVCTGTMLSLITTGDQVLAYQGTVAVPTFISAIHMNVYTTVIGDPFSTTAAAWDGAGSNTSSGSALPTGLTTGVNCIWIGTQDVSGSEKDNARFTCGVLDVSTVALARAALNNQANWATEDGGPTLVLPSGCNFVGILSSPPTINTQPSNSTICAGANTSFSITATGATSFQWQVDNGGGFANVSNGALYSGVTTTTLNITAATAGMNGYLYRCVATNGSGPTNSNPATLTVTALPTNPTLLAKIPATGTVADGTPVSATFNAGSGGSGGGCVDDFRYTTDGGTSYLPYTPGSNISTTGLAAGTGFVFIEGRRAGCGSGCQGSYIVLASWLVTPLPAGATTLNAGDIAFSGYTATTAPDEFSFVLLKNIGPGTVLNFTDNGFQAGALTNIEQTVTWTSNAAYAAGTEIKIGGLTATLASGGSAGTVTGTALSMATAGDQILAYTGTAGAPTFISAIHMNVFSTTIGDPVSTTAAAWDGAAATGTSASALPTGLTTGVNAIWIGTLDVPASEFDNSRYGNCAGPGTLGPITTLRAALNNQANWISDNGTPPGFTLPTGCPYLGVGNPPNITTPPANSTVCEGISTSFTVVAGGATSYQWQVDNGGGFANITNNATYSGATTATLVINATPLSFNGYLYRVIATNGSGSTTSASATLTVNALPVSPTLLAKTPAGNTVADGTPVSATFNAGSGGTGCSDDFRYTTDGGVSYLPYTPGNNISTTGLAAGSGYVFIEGRRANCSAGCQGAYTVLALWRVSPLPAAPTTLNAGDIGFSGYTSTSAGDDFSFVLLKNIGAGTVINFTNNGWLSTNVFRVGEETVTWTAPAGGLYAGTEISISALTATRSGGGAAGTVTGVALSLSTSGDQILAYRGSAAAPTFISAIHMNVYSIANGDPVTTTAAAWDGTANTTNGSALPTGLTTGVNAIWIGTQGVPASEFDNSRYGNCSGPGVLGPLTGLRDALNNQANWISTNGAPPGFSLPTGCNYLLTLCPTITVTNPANTAGIAGTAFSETFTSTGGTPVVTYSTSSTLPTGLSLSSAGVLSGTPTQTGTFPIVVTATDGSGCTGTGATYNLVISCQTNITVTNPVNTSGTAGTAFSETFTSANTIGAVTYTTASTLPAGLALSTAGVLSGTPTEVGTFPITVTVTDANGCTGTGSTYNLVISCPAPVTGTAAPASQTICSGAAITGIVLSGAPAGAVYNWTRDNTVAVTGIAASGSGNITGALTNTTAAPVTVTFTVIPTYYGTCTGTPYTATVTVNPNPAAFTITGGGVTVCPNGTTLSGPVDPNYTYQWGRSLTGAPFTNMGTAQTQAVTTSGNYQLVVSNQFGCSTTGPVTAVNVADYVFSGSLGVGDAQQTGRINRFAVVSTCAAPKACPGIFTAVGARFYDSYTITNIRNTPVCATIGLTSGCGTNIFNVAYLGSFNPAAPCTNYLGDPGSSFPASGFMEVTIPANGTIEVVVHEVNVGVGCANYTLTVDVPRDLSVIVAVPPSVTCNGTSTLTAPVAGSYLWSLGGAATQSIITPPLFVATTFYATMGYGNVGCTRLDSVTVAVTSVAPTITCPANITQNNTVGQCGSIVSYTTTPGGLPAPAVTYSFSGATTGSGAGDGSGSFFNVGTTNVTVTVTNACGSANCSFTVTIVDAESPAITCPAPLTVSCASAVPVPNPGGVTAADNCPGVVVTHQGDVISGQTCANRYIVTRTYRATDAANNFTECTQIITVDDQTPPVMTCPAPVTVSCASAVPVPNVADVTGVSDNCAGVVTVTHQGDVISAQTCANRYTITRTYRATDVCGNFAECTQIITVNDQTPPVMTCPAPVTVSCASAVPAPNINAVTGVSDNCAGVVTVTHQGDVISGQTCANRFTITRTYRATDVCGNFAECTQIITVNDQTPPVLTCPAPVTVSCAAAVPAPNINAVTGVSDNCAGVVTVTFVGDVISGQTCANRFTITRTYRATDVCGNFAQCTQIITVNDQTPPVVTCPAAVTVSCASAVPAPNITLVTATDNCGGVITITHIGDVISNQTCPNRYTITRTYRATDVCGNFAECTQIITVNDQTAPVITCPANITVTTPIGSCTAVVNFVVTATDNCNGAITIVSTPASGTAFPIGVTTVTSTATDACGNSSTCTFTITVLDGQLPVVTTQPVNRTVCVGSSATFSVVATNVVTYQWQQWNGSAWVNIPGANASSYTVTNATLGMNTNSFRAVLNGLCTVVNSNHATLYVNPLPSISLTASPLIALLPNQTTTITATVNPPGGAFVWSLNGSLIPGVTGPVLGPININGIGLYRAVYTDMNGCVSTGATIAIGAQHSNHLWVYPNPNTGQFNVRFFNQTGETATLKVFNSMGQIVYTQSLPLGVAYSNISVNLGNVPAGIYVVKIVNGTGAELAARRIVVYHP